MSSEQAVARLIELLERDGVPYMLVGALSSNVYGVPRATNDADLVIRFDSFNLIEFCDRLGDEFVLDRQMMVEGFTGSVRNVITYTPAGFQIEVFRLGDDPHHVERGLGRSSGGCGHPKAALGTPQGSRRRREPAGRVRRTPRLGLPASVDIRARYR
jgi:hypothetical protein